VQSLLQIKHHFEPCSEILQKYMKIGQNGYKKGESALPSSPQNRSKKFKK